jgi:hypothetical protein
VTIFVDGAKVEPPGNPAAQLASLQVCVNDAELILLRYNTPDFYDAVRNEFFGYSHA